MSEIAKKVPQSMATGASALFASFLVVQLLVGAGVFTWLFWRWIYVSLKCGAC